MEILILHKQGYSNRKIAKMLGISRNTIRKYLLSSNEDPCYQAREPVVIKLEPYKHYLQQRVQTAMPDWIPATVLYQEIKAMGYNGGMSRLRWYLRFLKPKPIEDPVVRFETEAGEQMQVDWAEFKYGKQRLKAFIATLGFSRYSYVEFVSNETVDTLIQCHQNAFDFFDGVTRHVLYDNMKAVVIKRHAYGEGHHKYQDKLWDYAKHMGFIPRLCRPYRAKTKGKVERFIGYLRRSFFNPLAAQFKSGEIALDDIAANFYVQEWLGKVANTRKHATTGEQPDKLWLEEKRHLQPLPPPYLGFLKPRLRDNNDMRLNVLLEDTILPLQHSIAIYEQIGQAAFQECYQ